MKKKRTWIRRLSMSLAVVLLIAGCTKTPAPTPPPAADSLAPADPKAQSIVRSASDISPPITRKDAQRVVVELETVEVSGHLADGTTFQYWTYGGTVPGPLVRVREDDTVEIRLKNNAGSRLIHSIDLHAVNGPGGGAGGTQVAPGVQKSFTFKALNPGVYVYHCATPHIPSHVAMGMYGLIVVEPKEGLPQVDREFYVMQGEIYTAGKRDAKGHLQFDGERMQAEQPTYVVFNGQAAALTGERALKANVGERIRLFIGNGGPNLISSFHIIGEVFDAVHKEGASEATHNVQTTLVPAGGAAWVEFVLDVPGRYLLVDHALTRAIDKGALAFIEVAGPKNHEVFDAPEQGGEGH